MKKYLPWLAMAGFALSLGIVVPALAATQGGAANWQGGRPEMRGGMPPGVFGTVASVSGDTLMVTQRTRPNATTTSITYTVDATNAKVIKNGTTSAVSSIATGDVVMVQGVVNGTSVTATTIRDGMGGMMGKRGTPGNGFGHAATGTPGASPIQGNGEPVIGGSVASINGETLTVTNASNVTYTVDATNAKIMKNGTTTAISSVTQGDNVIVQGTVDNTSVTASSIIDQGGTPNGTAGPNAPAPKSHFNLFSTIGNFFKNLFGF